MPKINPERQREREARKAVERRRRRRILRLPEVQERTGLSRSFIYNHMEVGSFPKPIPLSERSVGWLESDVEAWIDARVAKRDEAVT